MYYLFLADGFEETEAFVTLDMLRRAEIQVKTVSVNTTSVIGTHGIPVQADLTEDQFIADNCEGIILPGGMPGTENLYSSVTVMNAVEYCINNNLLIAAICAAPIILGRRGYLDGKNSVCFPGFENELFGAIINDAPVCVDSNIITAKGAGCVFQFACAVIEYISDKTLADKILRQLQYFPS